MKNIKFSNWSEYQHYKDRDPPWIKLHFAILSSRAWVTLDSKGRELAIVCMLLASRNSGVVACDAEYIKRVAYIKHEPDFDALVRCGLCIYDESLADASGCKQMLADASVSVSVSSSVSSLSSDAEPKKEVGEREAETIYGYYPRKEARAAAIKAIIAAQKKRGATFLLDRVKAYADAVALWSDDAKKFIPHPATWFNQGRYDDDPATWVRKDSPSAIVPTPEAKDPKYWTEFDIVQMVKSKFPDYKPGEPASQAALDYKFSLNRRKMNRCG